MTAQVTLELDDGGFAECGGTVTGNARWTGNDHRHQVGVVLRYWTEGHGDVDALIVARRDLGSAESGRERFRLDVPAGGPVTYHGQLIRLMWQVAVHLPARSAAEARATGLVDASVLVTPHGWVRRPSHLTDLA